MRLKIVDGNYGPHKAGIAQKSNFCYHILVKHAIENGERVGECGRENEGKGATGCEKKRRGEDNKRDEKRKGEEKERREDKRKE